MCEQLRAKPGIPDAGKSLDFDRLALERRFAATSIVLNARWLHSLGLHPETIESHRFEGAIRQETDGRIVFPIRDETGVVALSFRSTVGVEVCGQRQSGVWTSRALGSDRALVLVSDPIDALAAYQLKPDLPARYLAIDPA